MRQGCPLAPYLFLFIGEALNSFSKHALRTRVLQGIQLPNNVGQQLNVQYANDTNCTLLSTHQNLQQISRLLHQFYLASGLETNWDKCFAYWYSNDRAPSSWIHTFRGQRTNPGSLSKLLGIPFGIDLSVEDVDSFLFDKIKKKMI